MEWPALLAVTGLILWGTLTSLLAKIVYGLDGVGKTGDRKLFRKPYCMTTVMFMGMCGCLPVSWALALWRRRRAAGKAASDAAEPLLPEPGKEEAQGSRKQILLLAIPTAFDLIATVLMNVGLLSVTASVYQIMRGAEMLFAATFSVLFLHRRLNRLHLLGILCCVIGIGLVGTSSVLGGDSGGPGAATAAQLLFGMGLIVASQAVQAAQITIEDAFLHVDVPALTIVGWEGVYGVLFMGALVLPLMAALPGEEGSGLHEDSWDTLHLIGHSPSIAWVLVVDMVALLLYNLAGMCVTGELGAVFRTVLETMRTLFVWLVDLLLFYSHLGPAGLGEQWTSWSFLQAAGFLVLVCGTLVYGRGDEREGKALEEDLGPDAGPSPRLPDVRQSGERARTDGIPVAGTSGRRSSSAARPIGTPNSFKATMNINSFGGGSYRPSFSHSAAQPLDTPRGRGSYTPRGQGLGRDVP